MKAYCLIREGPHYRHEAFGAGLKAAGYQVLRQQRPHGIGKPGDVLVIWNRYGDFHRTAVDFENCGGTVIVAENPYFGFKGDNGEPTGYALALHGHNGSGEWFPGDASRFEAMGVPVAPWQQNDNGHILVCGQRGIGSPRMASPPDWHNQAARKLAGLTKRRIVVRTHPEGPQKPARPLAEDMAGAWAVVIWSSSSGIQALVQGIPVFFDAPHWICEKAAPQGLRLGPPDLEKPWRNDVNRMTALREMAWAQWSLDEIARGVPFQHLLQRERATA